MELTREWTAGPRLSEGYAWEDFNVYGTLADGPDALWLVERFTELGWSARDNGERSDGPGYYEVQTEWVRLEFFCGAPSGTLLKGVMDVARLHELAGVLAGFGLRYSLETWDDDQENVLEELRG